MIFSRFRLLLMRFFHAFPTRLHAWIIAAYWIFIAIQFLVSSNLAYTLWFYLAVAVPFLIYAARHPHEIRAIAMLPIAKWITLLLAYTLIHALFLTNDYAGLSRTLWHTTLTTIFMLASVMALRLPPALFSRLLTAMIYLATIMGIAAIAWHMGYVGMTRRLEAFGRTDHAILGANVFAVFALSGVYLAHPRSPLGTRLFLPALVCTVVAVLIAFTESRGPMLSFHCL
jgi:hypothetical protein